MFRINEPYFYRNFSLTDCRQKRRKNTIDLLIMDFPKVRTRKIIPYRTIFITGLSLVRKINILWWLCKTGKVHTLFQFSTRSFFNWSLRHLLDTCFLIILSLHNVRRGILSLFEAWQWLMQKSFLGRSNFEQRSTKIVCQWFCTFWSFYCG